MKKITITQYSEKSYGSTLGTYLYHFSIDFNGDWGYDCTMTEEGMYYLRQALNKGNQVEFIKKWEQKDQRVLS